MCDTRLTILQNCFWTFCLVVKTSIEFHLFNHPHLPPQRFLTLLRLFNQFCFLMGILLPSPARQKRSFNNHVHDQIATHHSSNKVKYRTTHFANLLMINCLTHFAIKVALKSTALSVIFTPCVREDKGYIYLVKMKTCSMRLHITGDIIFIPHMEKGGKILKKSQCIYSGKK